MPTILITRPAWSADALKETLEAEGFETFLEPLLTLVPVHTPRPPSDEMTALIITSQNALAFLDPSILPTTFFQYPCYCVGERTASRAREKGFKNLRIGDGDGMDLINLITKDFHPQCGSLLHLAGHDIHEAPFHELRKRGWTVSSWILYRALKVSALTNQLESKLKNGEIAAVPLFSQRTAEHFLTLIQQHKLAACCNGIVAIGLSEPISNQVRVLPWKELVTTSHPTVTEVIHELRTRLSVKGPK